MSNIIWKPIEEYKDEIVDCNEIGSIKHNRLAITKDSLDMLLLYIFDNGFGVDEPNKVHYVAYHYPELLDYYMKANDKTRSDNLSDYMYWLRVNRAKVFPTSICKVKRRKHLDRASDTLGDLLDYIDGSGRLLLNS